MRSLKLTVGFAFPESLRYAGTASPLSWSFFAMSLALWPLPSARVFSLSRRSLFSGMRR